MKKVICSTIVTILSCLFVLLFPKTVSALPQCYIDQLAQAEAEVQRTTNELNTSFQKRDACKVALDLATASGDPVSIAKANDEYENSKAQVLWQAGQYANAIAFLNNVKKRNATEESKEKYDSFLVAKGKYEIAASEITNTENLISSITTQIALTQNAINTYTVSNDIANINALNIQLNSLNAQLLQAQNDLTLKKAAKELCLDELEKYCDTYFLSADGYIYVTYKESPMFKERNWNK